MKFCIKDEILSFHEKKGYQTLIQIVLVTSLDN